jgi:predicted flap endonuclease-1-like 5' DNA nuclease
MNIVEILINLFSFENNSEAVVFYSIIFLALLLGIFFAYLLVTRPILRKKRKQISGLQSDLEMANSKIKLTEEKYTVQLSKIKRHEEEATKMQVLIDELQTKSSNYQNEIGQLQFEKETLQRKAENCEKEILELKNLYNISLQENISTADRYSLLMEEKNQALSRVEDYLKRVENLENELKNASTSAEELNESESNRNATLEKLELEKNILKEENFRLNLLLNEKEQQQFDSLKQISLLKQQISAEEKHQEATEIPSLDLISTEVLAIEDPENEAIVQKNEQREEVEEDIAVEAITETDLIENEQATEISASEENKDTIVNSLNANEYDLLLEIKNFVGISNSEQRDNLKLINGIDAELEEKLHAFGINTYEQLSRLNDESINQKLCQLIQIKGKSIETDQWEAQARQLLIKQKINNLTKDMNLSKLFKK